MKKLFVLISFIALAGLLFLTCQRDTNPVGTSLTEGPQLAGKNADVLHVPGDYTTIQAAIDAASEGAVILVGPGEYAGAVVNKAVEIKGAGGAVINSGPLPWPGVRTFMAGFLFDENFSEEYPGRGDDAKISHLKFETVEFPVFSRGADDVIVEHCTCENSIQAVTNWHGSRWVISHNDILDLRTFNGGGIGILAGSRFNGIVNDNTISHNKISGTLHVDPNDGGGYCGTGIVLYADYRWGFPGADEIAHNRIVQNKISLTSDTPEVVPVVAIELTDTRNDPEADPYPVVFDNAIGFNDLRGTEDMIALTPEELADVNDISRNLGIGKGRGHGLHPAAFGPGGNAIGSLNVNESGNDGCKTIQDGIYASTGELIVLGYDQWGYNYQAHMFNGRYCDYDRVKGGDYCDVKLIMKWNDAWMSNMDCDGDGKLDRHFGFSTYIGSGAWETNHQFGEDIDEDGNVCKWEYFVKIVAVPSDANKVDGVWYAADGTEIGPDIWGQFAIIQQVYNSPCEGAHGIEYLSPAGPGFGKYKAEEIPEE